MAYRLEGDVMLRFWGGIGVSQLFGPLYEHGQGGAAASSRQAPSESSVTRKVRFDGRFSNLSMLNVVLSSLSCIAAVTRVSFCVEEQLA